MNNCLITKILCKHIVGQYGEMEYINLLKKSKSNKTLTI